MKNKYIISLNENKCLEIMRPNSSVLVYKIPYEEFSKRVFEIEIANRFIVYILVGHNDNNEKIAYVGKSKNGTDNRPNSHEKEDRTWETCYILTSLSEKTFLSDAAILYIENKIHNILKTSPALNTVTKTTTSETANFLEAEFCDDFWCEASKMLFVLGLDLLPKEETTPTLHPHSDLSEIADAFANKIF